MAASENNGAFDPAVMSADLATVRGLFRAWFGQVKTKDWGRPTDPRPKGWSVKETFCHIVAIAELLDRALEHTLDVNITYTSPIKDRESLSAFNRKEIDRRKNLPPEYLLQSFLEALSSTQSRIDESPDLDLTRPVDVRAYNRPLTIAEIIGNTLTHPSIVHGAQLTVPIGMEPIWRQFSADFMHRQLTRFFHIFSHSYWPERGGDLSALINFNIRGDGGGHWHVRLAEDGGSVGKGHGQRPNLTIHFADPNAFCSLFTLQMSPLQGLFRAKVFAWGNIPLAFKLPRLFTPT